MSPIKKPFLNRIAKFFSIGDLPEQLQRVSLVLTTIYALFSLGMSSTDSFFLLYLLESWDYDQIALIFTTQMVTQLLLDYPTGVLGDWLGQKKIIILAFLMKIGSLCILIFSTSFQWLIFYGLVSGIGNSQLSGALDSWFDNNYKKLSEGKDDNREIYTRFQAKLTQIYILLAGISCGISGLLATIFSRKLLFAVEIFFYSAILVIVLRYIEAPRENAGKKHSLRGYFALFTKGIRFTLQRKGLLLLFLGFSIMEAFLNGVWTKFILMPYFKGYSVSDANLGILRWIDLTLDVILLGFIKKIPAKSTKPKKGFIQSQVGLIGGFVVIIVFLYIFPPEETFNFGKFIGIIVFGLSLGIPYRLVYLFYSKMLVDLIPNDIRNSIYSLIPTLILIFSIPANIIGGSIIGTFDLQGGILYVMVGIIAGIALQQIGFKINQTTSV